MTCRRVDLIMTTAINVNTPVRPSTSSVSGMVMANFLSRKSVCMGWSSSTNGYRFPCHVSTTPSTSQRTSTSTQNV